MEEERMRNTPNGPPPGLISFQNANNYYQTATTATFSPPPGLPPPSAESIYQYPNYYFDSSPSSYYNNSSPYESYDGQFTMPYYSSNLIHPVPMNPCGNVVEEQQNLFANENVQGQSQTPPIDYELEQKLRHFIKSGGSLNLNEESTSMPTTTTSTNSTVIRPIIENLVGSMSMNGTYTHFGGLNNGNANGEISSGFGNHHSYSQVASTGVTADDFSYDYVQPGKSMQYGDLYSGNYERSTGNESPVGALRASTPNDSRPQTPGKPSYLEILTKNTPKVTPVFRKASSSPVQEFRKSSVDEIGFWKTNSGSSSSASSSPLVKPKLTASNSNGLPGKENRKTTSWTITSSGGGNSSGNSKHSTGKNTPVSTPTHKQYGNVKVKDSQRNSTAQLTTNNNSSNKDKRKFSGDFEFDQLDGENESNEKVDEDEKEGWKTAKGRHVGHANVKKVNGFQPERKLNSFMNFEHVNATASSNVQLSSGQASSSSTQTQRKVREKEKPRSRKEDRNDVARRVEQHVKLWIGRLISALSWLWTLVVDVTTLSVSLVFTLLQDFYSWWKSRAVPTCHLKWIYLKEKVYYLWQKCRWKSDKNKDFPTGMDSQNSGTNRDDLLALMGPDRNISLPVTGDDALKRLLGCKGHDDPYSILGVRSDSSDETIRRYYKKQAVLVHPDKNLVPGAEEAFKILARAFELIGDLVKRVEYHQKLLEAHAKERVCGEISNLLEQLRKKMEAVSSTIRCTKCNSRHKKNRTDRPIYSARYCAQCRISHAAREGELWAERTGFFGLSWEYFACMDCHVWEINEWAKCQRKNLKHLRPDSHSVLYRLVAGGGNGQQETGGQEDNFGPVDDDWDSLINKWGPTSSSGSYTKSHRQTGNGCCSEQTSCTSRKSKKGKRK